jgi:hypothetical protein
MFEQYTYKYIHNTAVMAVAAFCAARGVDSSLVQKVWKRYQESVMLDAADPEVAIKIFNNLQSAVDEVLKDYQ